jgi:hypothetical protein
MEQASIRVGNTDYPYLRWGQYVVSLPQIPLVLQDDARVDLQFRLGDRRWGCRYSDGHAVAAFLRLNGICAWVKRAGVRSPWPFQLTGGWSRDVRISVLLNGLVFLDEVMADVIATPDLPVRWIWAVDDPETVETWEGGTLRIDPRGHGIPAGGRGFPIPVPGVDRPVKWKQP